MASNLFLPIKTLFDDKGLKDAQKEFGKFGSDIKKKLGAVLGGLGVGLGIGAVANVFREGAKAAAEDVKSQALLAKQLQLSAKANDEQIASVEASINAMQIQAAVADDDIRPAFAQLVRVTGDVAKSTDLMKLALDVAAGTGNDLQAVSIALGKAYQGNTVGLTKMGIKVKDASSAFVELNQQYGGMAATAANNDPFARISIIMQNVSEQIGMSILPSLEQFANWLATPKGQANLDAIVQGFVNVGKGIGAVFNFLADNSWVVSFVGGIAVAVGAFKALWTATKAVYAVTKALAIGEAIQAFFANAKNKVMTIASAIALVGGAAAFVGIDAMIGDFNARVESFTNKKYKAPVFTAPVLTPPSVKPVVNANNAAAKSAAELTKKNAAAYQAILNTEAQIYADAVQKATDANNAILEMRDSFVEVLNGVQPLKRAGKEIGEFEQQVVDSFTSIEETITSAVADGTLLQDAADNLSKYAASEKSTLAAIARQRDAITKKLDIAKAISSDVLSFGNINKMLDTQTKTVTETFTRMVNGIQVVSSRSFEQVVGNGLVDNFKKVIDKTKAFAKNLIELKRLGLNGQLFKQIVQAGVDAGGDTAQAIADGGQATVTELNDLFGQLNDLGGQVAAASTDVMYQAGEDVMNSFIQSLLDQDAALEATAVSLATKFAEAFKNTLATLSPLMAMPMQTGDIKLSDALSGYVSDQLGRTFTGPYNYYGQQGVAGTNSNYTININAGAISDKAGLPQMIVDALATYTRTSGTGALNRVLNL